MKKAQPKYLAAALGLLTAFVLWTIAVLHVDVQQIGPLNSAVGFAGINAVFHRLTGVHWFLYYLTDLMGLFPIAIAFGFALLGLCQWIRRRHLFQVDPSLFILGGFYLTTIALYIFFEKVPVNFRPVLVDGYLEASYPSSTTLLVLCVIPTAIHQLNRRIKKKALRKMTEALLSAFMLFTVIGRILSGVHWLSDIVGGMLGSAGLVMLYRYFICRTEK